MENIVCVISARGGSKGLPNKNIKNLLGKPMIAWSIEQALSCSYIKKVIVSTDSEEIASQAVKYGAEVPFFRPKELSSNHAGKWIVWKHALENIEKIYQEEVSIYVDLDCTSPLRDVEDIYRAIDQYKSSKVDAVFTICEARKNPYFNMVEELDGNLVISKKLAKEIIRRQDAPKVFETVASIYVLSPNYLRIGNGLLSGNTEGYLIDHEKSIDVDDKFDFEMVEFLMKRKYKNRKILFE